MYINHLTLSTGHISRTIREDIGDEVIDLLKPWLNNAIESGEKMPLPVAELSHFAASAYIESGGLVVTVFAPTGPHETGKPAKNTEMPLVTFAIAIRSRHRPLWDIMIANCDNLKDGLKMPDMPWIAVNLYETSVLYPDSLAWLGDFERCVAWTWLEK